MRPILAVQESQMDRPDSNLSQNPEYPYTDFMEDLAGAFSPDLIIPEPGAITIVDDTDPDEPEEMEVRFNTEHPLVRSMFFFRTKYGDLDRFRRFQTVLSTIDACHPQLSEQGLFIDPDDPVADLLVHEDVFVFLLAMQLPPKASRATGERLAQKKLKAWLRQRPLA